MTSAAQANTNTNQDNAKLAAVATVSAIALPFFDFYCIGTEI